MQTSPISRPSATTSITTSKHRRLASRRELRVINYSLSQQAYIHTRMRKRTADFLQGKHSTKLFVRTLANWHQSSTELDPKTRNERKRQPVDVLFGFKAKMWPLPFNKHSLYPEKIESLRNRSWVVSVYAAGTSSHCFSIPGGMNG